ncbi:hypothetical protein BC834DRAFT_406800 [Gloeopeniophorella convolvens]|nr:hypothetical protein BC834DRAFT_406800 [Gloeopeniophorella convolvens]
MLSPHRSKIAHFELQLFRGRCGQFPPTRSLAPEYRASTRTPCCVFWGFGITNRVLLECAERAQVAEGLPDEDDPLVELAMNDCDRVVKHLSKSCGFLLHHRIAYTLDYDCVIGIWANYNAGRFDFPAKGLRRDIIRTIQTELGINHSPPWCHDIEDPWPFVELYQYRKESRYMLVARSAR